MELRNNDLDIIIIEVKVYRETKEKDLQDTVYTVLAQIEEKNYDANLLAKGISKERIRYYGFTFIGKKILIRK